MTYCTCLTHWNWKADLKNSDNWQKESCRLSSPCKSQQSEKTISQQELVRQFPKAASFKLCCNVSTDAFTSGPPAKGKWSRAVQFPILTLSGTLKSVSDHHFPLHFASLYRSPLFPSIPGSWGWLLNWHLPPLQSAPASSVRPPDPASSPRGHPQLLFTDRKEKVCDPAGPYQR